MTIALHFGAQHRSRKLVDLICVSLRSTRMPIAVGVEHTDGGNEQPFLHEVCVGLHLWGIFEGLSYGLGRRRDDGHWRPGCVDQVDI